MLGILVGEPLIGSISDSFGRKIALMIGITLLSLAGGLAGVAHNFASYSV